MPDATRTEKNVHQLARDGDRLERAHWGHLRRLIPHYEEFWQTHVQPLRSAKSIWFRADLDPDCEVMAIANYSTFAAIARARHKIYSYNERFKYIEEQYAALQRALEIAEKLRQRFCKLYIDNLKKPCPVSGAGLDEFVDRHIRPYRNLLHDEMLAKPKDSEGRRLIPKRDVIDRYRNWTSVMYEMDMGDFVLAYDQVAADFRASCSQLESLWKQLCVASEALSRSASYRERLARGRDHSRSIATSLSKTFRLGSDAQFVVAPRSRIQ